MKDKLNITIRIADQPPLPLIINRDEEELIRQAESNVNRLWNNWSERFNASSEALLAMVAFQFAKLHAKQCSELESAQRLLRELDSETDQLLKR